MATEFRKLTPVCRPCRYEHIHAKRVQAECLHAERIHAKRIHVEFIHAERSHAERVRFELTYALVHFLDLHFRRLEDT